MSNAYTKTHKLVARPADGAQDFFCLGNKLIFFLQRMETEGKMQQKVLARAYGGEPIECLIWGEGRRVFYLIHPRHLSDVQAGTSGAIGFPREDVFRFDADLYARLREQWHREGRTNPAAWASAVRFDG